MKKLSILLTLVGTQQAFAGNILVTGSDEVTVTINKTSGSLLQFPVPIKTVTGSKGFNIKDVGAETDVEGNKADVKILSITPTGSKSDRVSFLLTDGRTVNAILIPSELGDKHYDVLFGQDAKKNKDPRHLVSEIDLMKAMIRDEASGYVRQVGGNVRENFSLDGFSAKVTRVFAGSGVKGFVYEIQNKTGKPQQVNASQFEAGPQTALVHLEKASLESCVFLSKPECTSKLFIVLRSQEKAALSLKTPFQKLEQK